jgi:UDP-N-acetylmuramoylalanine--D-glutamate ligase
LIQAAEFALSECQDGEVLLLSPGCSSFDEFKDFEHRGNTFRKWAISCFKGNTN